MFETVSENQRQTCYESDEEHYATDNPNCSVVPRF
jgi:hypothetical protein